MKLKDYTSEALRTDYETYEDFHTGEVTPRLDYATMGLVTETAKVLDIIKKSKKSERPLDREKLQEELGDVLWYLNLTLDELGMTFEGIMEANVKKIAKKHPEGDPLIRGKSLEE